jgi:hypothetical protein
MVPIIINNYQQTSSGTKKEIMVLIGNNGANKWVTGKK